MRGVREKQRKREIENEGESETEEKERVRERGEGGKKNIEEMMGIIGRDTFKFCKKGISLLSPSNLKKFIKNS